MIFKEDLYFIIQKNIINKNWLLFEIVIIFKDETQNLQGIDLFSKIHLYENVFLGQKDM
jgi:hypothetical protein